MKWIDDVILAIKILEALGNKRAKLADIYKVVWEIRHANGRTLPKAWRGTIRHTIYSNWWKFSGGHHTGFWSLRKMKEKG